MNRHHCRALIAIPFILAGALPLAGLSSTCVAGNATQSTKSSQEGGAETITPLPDLTATAAGEPLLYLSTPDPVISSDILTIPPGGISRWMTHPVPAYLYVLQGDLTVEFVDGKGQIFHAGQAFLQSRAQWHRGRNDGETPLRFLAVFLGAKGVPAILHPPATAQTRETGGLQ
jgi:quercetin dioxygenase-like cupin family protein